MDEKSDKFGRLRHLPLDTAGLNATPFFYRFDIDLVLAPERRIDDRLKTKVFQLTSILEEYKKFETEENKKRKKALQEVCDELVKGGLQVTIFIGGSLAAGQSIEGSDIDIQLFTNEEFDYEELRQRLSEKLEEKLGYRVKINFFGDNAVLANINDTLMQCETGAIPENFRDILDFYYSYEFSPLIMGYDIKSIKTRIETARHRSLVLNNAINSLSERLNNKREIFRASFRRYRSRMKEHSSFLYLSENDKNKLSDKLDSLERIFLVD